MIFVNFKTYKEGTGKCAVELVQIINSVFTETKVPIIPVVQIVDARMCVNTSPYEVWIQHSDSVGFGQHTGWTTPEAVFTAGVSGVFLNHSEHKITHGELQISSGKCQSLGLRTMLFAKDIEELKEIVLLKTDFVAYEPPELIASKQASVASAKSEVIKHAVKVSEKIPLIVGAGVKSKSDVEVSLRLGACGVAVSSAVVLSENPREVLLDLVGGFK